MEDFFFTFLELKFVSGMFVHCFAGKGAVLLSLYCCFYYYNYSYHHHHCNYYNYYCYNCVNNKMLEYDWFLTAHIYSLILLDR